ncbi:MAG TPA: NahK/ErcS family hybrid sensor histidine kinase/response regulator [Casimicrobiaceae bacterium]|nr:NahK/ErcS family hybrid sensor histidine kinase/response regulator [Casimicrobiaceae bacterium]
MLSSWTLFTISTAYVALLFAIAYYGDRRARLVGAPLRKPWIYSLALAVYCTSWTFYGAVGHAATSGWDFLPIYLGPILVFAFCAPLLRRVVRISKRHNITSIADFVGARYGRHQPIAMLITAVAVIGVLPYIALQLKAVEFGFAVLSVSVSPPGGGRFDNALLVAAMLAAFAILFGTREVLSTENHHGMVLAVAFESVIKLIAFVAVGLYAAYVLNDGFIHAYSRAMLLPQVRDTMTDAGWQAGFVAQTLLAGVAIFCLPRQFQVVVVENTSVRDLDTARWLFPLYLGIICVLVMPIAQVGLVKLAGTGTPGDTFMVSLPLAEGQQMLALGAYIGGFSAATSMVIVETIAISTMICNELVMPVLLRFGRIRHVPGQDVARVIRLIRRVAIVATVALAYVYYRLFTGPGTLTQIGLLSFAAVAQFAPSIIGGVYWKAGRYPGVIAGLAAGTAVWGYTLLLPELLSTQGAAAFAAQGPFGLSWLSPHGLFGIGSLDPIAHGTLWSLGLNTLAYVGVSLMSKTSLHDRLHAARFLGEAAQAPQVRALEPPTAATVADLRELLECFVGPSHARNLIESYSPGSGKARVSPHERADPRLVRIVEHGLAGALGASSARLVMASMLRGRDMQLEEVVRLLDETSHEIHFNRELLRASLEHLAQGVSVVDAELRVVAWNHRYIEMFDYPPGLVVVGRPIEDLMRYNAARGLLSNANVEHAVRRRLDFMRAGSAYTHERALPNGTVLEIRGNPMPGGGFVSTYSDVTLRKRSQRALEEANELLEARVSARTRELTALNKALAEAKSDADRANFSKTRFLAAASHDLTQPITAARLFVTSLDSASLPGQAAALIRSAESALTTAEALLAGLLDISRLDAGAEEVRLEHLEIRALLEPLVGEFRLLAREKGLQLRYAASSAIVHTDGRLLRRILQNFLSNAVRYTRYGTVLIGSRRCASSLRIEVWDSGPGIPASRQREIFEEFRRIESPDGEGHRGLGLGLAIAERTARLLRCALTLHSWPGHGSVFAITVPLGERLRTGPAAATRSHDPDRVFGAVVMCVENEVAVLGGIRALLSRWGCEVVTARTRAAALEAIHFGAAPDLLLVDYHLDADVTGVELAGELASKLPGAVPCIIMTADQTQQSKRDAAAHGFQILHKPLKPAALRAMLNRMLAVGDAETSLDSLT